MIGTTRESIIKKINDGDFDSDDLASIVWAEVPDSMNAELDRLEPPASQPPRLGFSLFWRTLVLLMLLLLASSLGWYELFKHIEYEPRVINSARQVSSLVNLSRAALTYSDSIARLALIKTLAEQEKVRILPRKPEDKYEPFTHTALERRINKELIERLGPGAITARSVNQENGLWVGFSFDGDSYWLLMDRSRINEPLVGRTWLLWLAILAALSVVGAIVLASLINQPLRRLAAAAARVREGDYQKKLNERVLAKEIREVNISFNRMADQLSKIESDRTDMLAGISHDIRTPLARLRLETEMSVPDPETRALMAADISHVDSIIDKFLDYARPDHTNFNNLQALPLVSIAIAATQPFCGREDMVVQIDIPSDIHVIGDEIELTRVLANLLENARRYGRTPGTDVARVRIEATACDDFIVLRVRDYGPGVPNELLSKLARPFYRGDTARTAAKGTGLGLAIVAKVLQNMGATLEFGNSSSGGLMAIIKLAQADPPY